MPTLTTMAGMLPQKRQMLFLLLLVLLAVILMVYYSMGLNPSSSVMKVSEHGLNKDSKASEYLIAYDDLFNTNGEKPLVPPDANIPETISTWWQAAALIDWYLNGHVRYTCKSMSAMGNWHICQDKPFTIQPPCLVYSFGINWDFSFDDAMAQLGCDVHSFDPSMKEQDHSRGNNGTFYNLGLSNIDVDDYIPKQDMYVKERQVWKMRTVKSIMKELGHENRVIDVFKMDIEGHEWAVLDNMIATNVFRNIRQYMLEVHLFPNFPKREKFVSLYKTYTKLRNMGFKEFDLKPHPKTLESNKFNIQGDAEFVNVFFNKEHKR